MKSPLPRIANTQEKRQELVRLLMDRIASGESAKAALETVWSDNEKVQRAEQVGDFAPKKGAPSIHVALAAQRQDALVAQTAQVVLRQKPVMLATDGWNPERFADKEKLLHWAWRRGGFEKAARSYFVCATNTNRAFFRLTYEHQPKEVLPEGADNVQPGIEGPTRYEGLRFDFIHPRDMVVYPSSLGGELSASLIGHRFEQSLVKVKERILLGEYMQPDQDLLASPSDPKASSLSRYSSAANERHTEQDRAPVRCFSGIVRLIDPESRLERYYLVTLDTEAQVLLSIDHYPYSRPWYFSGGFLPSEQYWDLRSVAQSLRTLGDLYNRLISAHYYATMKAADPEVYGPELEDEKDAHVKFGERVAYDGAVQPWSPKPEYNGSSIVQMLMYIERAADSASRTSVNMLGQAENDEITATQTSTVAQNVSIGISEYIGNVSEPFPAMAAFSMELLADHVASWQELYPEQEFTKQNLLKETIWEPNGKSPGSTPMARIMSLQQLWAMANDPESRLLKAEIARLTLANSQLPGAEGLQLNPDELNNSDGIGAAAAPLQPGMDPADALPLGQRGASNDAPLEPLPDGTVRAAVDFQNPGGDRIDPAALAAGAV